MLRHPTCLVGSSGPVVFREAILLHSFKFRHATPYPLHIRRVRASGVQIDLAVPMMASVTSGRTAAVARKTDGGGIAISTAFVQTPQTNYWLVRSSFDLVPRRVVSTVLLETSEWTATLDCGRSCLRLLWFGRRRLSYGIRVSTWLGRDCR